MADTDWVAVDDAQLVHLFITTTVAVGPTPLNEYLSTHSSAPSDPRRARRRIPSGPRDSHLSASRNRHSVALVTSSSTSTSPTFMSAVVSSPPAAIRCRPVRSAASSDLPKSRDGVAARSWSTDPRR